MVSYNFCQISHPTLILPLFIFFLSLLNSVPGGGEVWQGIDHVINQIIIISVSTAFGISKQYYFFVLKIDWARVLCY